MDIREMGVFKQRWERKADRGGPSAASHIRLPISRSLAATVASHGPFSPRLASTILPGRTAEELSGVCRPPFGPCLFPVFPL